MKLKWAVPLVFLVVLALCLAGMAQNYAPVTNYPTSAAPQGLTQGDFNEDGKPDIAVTDFNASSIQIFPGTGDGTFGPAIATSIAPHPYSVAAADLNGDGHLDLVVSLITSQGFEVLFGNGQGQFQSPTIYTVSGLSTASTVGQAALKDINGDGKIDVVLATDRGVALFINNGSGGFTQEPSSVDSANVIANVSVLDLDSDGIPDLVATESTFDINGNATGTVVYALGHGDGTFSAITNIADLSGPPTGLAVADVDHDGLLDVVVSFASSTIGTGGGTPATGCTPRICLPQDGGGGGTTLPVRGGIGLIRQTAKLQFASANSIGTDQNPGFLVAGDFDGDGRIDVAEASTSQPQILLYRGNGDGTFGAALSLSVPGIAAEIASGSFTQTTALDLFASDNASNQLSVFVNQGANTLTLVSSVNPAAVSQQVTLTATVEPKFSSAATLSGSIIFADGATTLGTATVDSSGIGRLNTAFTAAGDHPLTAVYSGNSSFAGGSSAKLNQHVAVAPNVALSSSVNPSSIGQSVNFTVTVAAGGSGPAPSGTVTLSANGTPLLTGAIDASGTAVLTTSSLPLGTDDLVAQYSGDSNYPGVDSQHLAQVVHKSNSTTTLTSSANPSVFGQSVNFAISVAAPFTGGHTPSGSVNLKDGGTAVASAALDASGAAVISLSNLSIGTHSFTVDYAGDANFNSSSSAAVSQVVTTTSTTASLSCSPNPSSAGQAVTLSAVVKAATGTPSGVVVFSDGSVVLGSANLNASGTTVLTVTSLAVGSHNLTASYAGSGGFLGSTSAVVTQVVNRGAVKIVLSASASPTTFGQSLTLSAAISASSAGTGKIPTGSISFVDGTTILGQGLIDNTGNAVFTTGVLAAGSHSLSATYAGDSNFSAGSASLNEVINKAATTTTLTSSLNPATNVSNVSLHAVVTSGAGTPSGAVQFFDGATSIGSSVLDSAGSASLSVASLAVGNHVLTASYAGTSNLANSASQAVTETVVDSHSQVVLASSANPQSFSQPVVFTATVTPALSGQQVSGTIIFRDGIQILATVPVSNGSASFSTTHLTVGTHSIRRLIRRRSLPVRWTEILLLWRRSSSPRLPRTTRCRFSPPRDRSCGAPPSRPQ